MAGNTIAILGGGVGGLVAANELRRRIGSEHRIVLIDRERRHLFSPSLLWMILGLRTPDRVSRDLNGLCKKGI